MRTFYEFIEDNTFDGKLQHCARLVAELDIEDPISAFIEANREAMPNLEVILLEAFAPIATPQPAPTGFGAIPQGPSPLAAGAKALWGGLRKAWGSVAEPYKQAKAQQQAQQNLRGLEDKYQNTYKVLQDLQQSLNSIPTFKNQAGNVNSLFGNFLQQLQKQHQELSALATSQGSGAHAAPTNPMPFTNPAAQQTGAQSQQDFRQQFNRSQAGGQVW
jgi:hypothetical protein